MVEQEETLYEFPKDPKVKTLVRERKGINRALVKRLLASKKFSYEQIADYVGCSTRHLRRIRDELIEANELTNDEAKKGMGIVAAEFDEECIRATGESFKTFIQNKRKRWKTPFNFCKRTWKHVWGEPSIFLMMDRQDPTGAEMCQLFLKAFGNNKKRIRDYKKYIRPFFVFINRDDLKEKYMSMSATQDPEGVREVPQLEFIDFPLKLDKAISAFEKIYGVCDAALIKWKITSGLRTGDKNEERGWVGIRKKAGDENYKSYIFFDGDPDKMVCSVFEKMSEQWRINWIPSSIRKELYKIYQRTAEGDSIVSYSADQIRQRWYEVSEPILGFRLEFHDFRKVFATWLIIMGVQFNEVAKLNVGWADLDTLDKNYNQVKSAWKKSDMALYRENIPDWFKEDLEEYVDLK
jgi:integrase